MPGSQSFTARFDSALAELEVLLEERNYLGQRKSNRLGPVVQIIVRPSFGHHDVLVLGCGTAVPDEQDKYINKLKKMVPLCVTLVSPTPWA